MYSEDFFQGNLFIEYIENSQMLNGIFEVVCISTPELKMASILKFQKYSEC